ncbi:MAG: hypothetical protein V8Q28_04905 [Alistipes sp.]
MMPRSKVRAAMAVRLSSAATPSTLAYSSIASGSDVKSEITPSVGPKATGSAFTTAEESTSICTSPSAPVTV